jgi:hypothetical protein
MKILVGCEESGIVRDALIAAGHDAVSCDLLPSRRPGPHLQCDVRDVLGYGWDAAIFFTPCTYLSNSGVRWLHERPERWDLMRRDAELFRDCMNADIPMTANENPIPHKYALEIIGRKYDQIIQPWEFGHGETKATCLWLKNLPPLLGTYIHTGREQRIWLMPPSETRQRDRSVTFNGIAHAMSTQWFTRRIAATLPEGEGG